MNLSNVINFAHGNFLALGGYSAFVLGPIIGYWHGAAGGTVRGGADRPDPGADDNPPRLFRAIRLYSLLLTFGLAFIIQDVCRSDLGVQRAAAERAGGARHSR